MGERIVLQEGLLAVAISALGAEMTSFMFAGEELLWQGDPRWWPRQSPILFPIVGRVRNGAVLVGERTCPMPQHGFAHGSTFQVLARSDAHCLMRLCDSAATSCHYPFAFTLDLQYRLTGGSLCCEAWVRNTGKTALPASFGFHPGFGWPLQRHRVKEDYELWFEDAESLSVARLDAQGLLQPVRQEMPLRGGRLSLHDDLFDAGAMILPRWPGKRVRYQPRDGKGLSLCMSTAGFPQLGLWMKPGADFICLEPWHGLPDAPDFEGPLEDKPGMAHIAPGASASWSMALQIVVPGTV